MKNNTISQKEKFMKSMAEPDADGLSADQLVTLVFNYFLTGLYLVFIISAAYVTFSSPDLKTTAADFIARLLAASAARTGNHDLPVLMTGLVTAVVILIALMLWITSMFRGDHKEIVKDGLETTHVNIINMAEKLADMDERLTVLHHRLVIEPAMELLGEREGAIDRETGKIVFVGKLDEYDFDPDEILIRQTSGYCPICDETYAVTACPECHNPAVPTQVDPNCSVCGGTGKFGQCKLRHKTAEKRAFDLGPLAHRLYRWSQQLKKITHPYELCSCGKLKRSFWRQVGNHDNCQS
jgi:hypothetical protein